MFHVLNRCNVWLPLLATFDAPVFAESGESWYYSLSTHVVAKTTKLALVTAHFWQQVEYTPFLGI